MTPHPQRCETCQHRQNLGDDEIKVYYCREAARKNIILECGDQYDFMGCASHSSAPTEQEIRQDEREKVLEGVRVKLSKLKTTYPTGADFVWWLVIDTALNELRSKQEQP